MTSPSDPTTIGRAPYATLAPLYTAFEYFADGPAAVEVINTGNGGDPEDHRIDSNVHSDGSNDDSIRAGGGDDNIASGFGNDTVNIGDGNNVVHTEAGGDSVLVAQCNETLYSADWLEGWYGEDTLLGSDGNDFVDADIDSDLVYGGADNDTFVRGYGMSAQTRFMARTMTCCMATTATMCLSVISGMTRPFWKTALATTRSSAPRAARPPGTCLT